MQSISFRDLKNEGFHTPNAVLAFFFLSVSIVGMSLRVWGQQPVPASSSSQQTQSSTASQPSQSAPNSTPASGDAKAPEKAAGNDQPAINGPSLPPGIDPVTKRPLYETIQEDWSSLAIGTSHLDPEAPFVVENYDGYSYTRSLVRLKWRPGDPLDVYVLLPKDVKNPPAVLYLYSYKDDTDRFRDERWCRSVTAQGFAAIGFVSALSGHRFHDRPMRQWFVSELQESIGSTVHDVKFILDYLAERGDIDMKRIGMFGQSSGGTIAILAAAADRRIRVVDALDPWGDWPVWLKDSWVPKVDPDHEQYTSPEFLSRVAPLDPVKWLPTLKTQKIRIQQVMDNDATPEESKDALKKAAPKQAQIVRWDHAGQFMEASRGPGLFSWTKTQLKSLPSSKPAPRSSIATRATTLGVAGNNAPTTR